MVPLISYKDLLRELEWNREKREEERWYIFLLMNPHYQTNAGVDIIKNLSYLNRRTGNVTFFLPGFLNNPDETRIMPFHNGGDSRVIYHDDTFGGLYFDEYGFFDTIQWLEEGSKGKYQYSEGLDLVLVKYNPNHRRGLFNRYDYCFDRERLLFYNLDDIKERKINILRFIIECMRIVSSSFELEIVKHWLDRFISIPINAENARTINVFVAGAKDLEKERNAVIAALDYVNAQTSDNYSICTRTFEYFDRSLAPGGRQEDYNRFIREVADFVIFILDNRVGAVTFEEFEVAMSSFKVFRRPKIYVYSRRNDYGLGSAQLKEPEHISDVQKIRNHLSAIGQYYDEYLDLRDLKSAVTRDFLSLAVRKLDPRSY